MRNWASSGRVKIDRAHVHIRDLEARINEFRKLDPYQVWPDEYPEDIDGIAFYMRVIHELPPSFSAIAADAVHNLHVALDHMWQRAVYGSKSRWRDSFPAAASPERAKARFRGKEKGRLKTAVDILKSVNAFEIGNQFWRIREFDDADKHDTMSLVACALTSFSSDIHHVHYGVPGPLTEFTLPDFQSRVIEDGARLFSFAGSVEEVYVSHELAFDVAFGVGDVLEGEPVVPTLEHFAQTVDGLASAFITAGLLT